ncbi:MAG: YicC family protein [Pyrinomonadaceae bacterium]|nr:YicC family protein [Acidobacteriota bacterium]MBP7376742.1 YicC family protein [Pyrinomonadaceae bacterium]
MRSMTGFGRATVTGKNLSIAVELKTVNNRFLDVNLRLGSEVQQLESTIKRLIGNRLSRGRVDVNLNYDRTEEVAFELNRPVITGFLAAMKQMKDEFSLTGEPDMNVIAKLPNVFSTKKEDPTEEFLAGIETAFTLALDDLEKMRDKEGEMLETVLEGNLAAIEQYLEPIKSEAANIADEHRIRLNKRITDMLAKSESQIEVDQTRLAQEVAYLADRADISEEIDRLTTHIEHFRTIIKETRDVGKRLDFLTQELNREANTITSKTNNMIVKENALAIKSEIEKIREQVQNVE